MRQNRSLALLLCILAPLIGFSQTYLGPIQPVPGDPHLVRIQIIVRDSPESGGVQIQNVEFDHQTIPLKPRDIYGNRGGASFQLPPGKRKLRWVVQRDKTIWPRTISHEEEVNIDPRDYWIQILIVGETATIN
jgi:hypothetical protein